MDSVTYQPYVFLCVESAALLSTIIARYVLTAWKHGKQRVRRIQGNLPIDKTLFFLGKQGLVGTWLLGILSSAGVELSWPWLAPVWMWWVAICVAAVGWVWTFFSVWGLGLTSFKFGLPDPKKEVIGLTTTGIYGLSRNPMYVGFHMLTLACCLAAPNPGTWVLALESWLVHHCVIVVEEEFLKEHFEDYAVYQTRVRRYL